MTSVSLKQGTELTCSKCGSASYVKNGVIKGHQRYKCKRCQKNFFASRPLKKSIPLRKDSDKKQEGASSFRGRGFLKWLKSQLGR